MIQAGIVALINKLNAQMGDSLNVTLSEAQALAELLPAIQGVLSKTLGPWRLFAENEWWRDRMGGGYSGALVRKTDSAWRIVTMNSEITLPSETPVEVCKELADVIARIYGFTLLSESPEISEEPS